MMQKSEFDMSLSRDLFPRTMCKTCPCIGELLESCHFGDIVRVLNERDHRTERLQN